MNRRTAVKTSCVGGLLLVAGCESVAPPIALNDIFLRPTPQILGTPADYGYAFESLFVPIDETRKVSIWHVKAENPKAIVVIIPGSDKNKSRYIIGLPVFIPNGYDVILMDYEGFGESPGENTLQNLVDDGRAVVDYALSRHSRVVAFGISTGASAAVRASNTRDLAALLLEAPLIIKDEPELYLRYIGVNLPFFWNVANAYTAPQIPADFDVLRHVRDADEPKLIMASVADDVVTFESGVRVFAAAAEPKEFFEMRGEHGEMIEIDFVAYRDRVIGWLDKTLGLTPAGIETSASSVGTLGSGGTAIVP